MKEGDKVEQVFITGADRGVGFALCEQFAMHGYQVLAGQYMPEWKAWKASGRNTRIRSPASPLMWETRNPSKTLCARLRHMRQSRYPGKLRRNHQGRYPGRLPFHPEHQYSGHPAGNRAFPPSYGKRKKATLLFLIRSRKHVHAP